MKAITLRNLPPRVAQAVRQRAKQEKLSLNRAVLQLIEQGLGAPKISGKALHRDLDFLCGAWTGEEADEFDEALASQRAVDQELWK